MGPGILNERWVLMKDVGRDDANVPVHFPGLETMVPDGKLISYSDCGWYRPTFVGRFP